MTPPKIYKILTRMQGGLWEIPPNLNHALNIVLHKLQILANTCKWIPSLLN